MNQSSLEDNQLEPIIDDGKGVEIRLMSTQDRIVGHTELQTIKIFVDEEAPLS